MSNSTLARTTACTLHTIIQIGCLVILATSGISLADEESEEVATHVLAAETALNQHEYQNASAEYRMASELSEDPEVAGQATRIAYTYGFNDDAIRAARRWVELDPDDDEAMLYMAQLYLRTGEIRESRRAFEKLLKKDDSPVDERLMALIPMLSQEDPTNGYELMRQLARPFPKSVFARYSVAIMALQAGDTETAGKEAKQAIAIDPDWVKPHLLYARSLLLSGDEAGAIDYASRLVGDDPDPDPEARLELAIMLVSAGRDDDALSQVNQILLEQPYRTDALRLMAIINFRLDHMDAAKADFEDLLASGNFQMDALYYLGRIADRRDEFEEAIRNYSQVTSGDNAVLSQSRAAGIMAQQGEHEKALKHLSSFAEINPNFAVDMLRAKAQLMVSIDRNDEALELFDQVVTYRPDDEGVRLGRAALLLRMGRLDDAIGQYRHAVERWPESSMSLNALGYTLADMTDQYDEAEKLIRKALDLEPDSAAIIDSWGWVLYRQGRSEEALGFLEKAYEKLRDPEVAGHIVEVLLSLDRADDAVRALQQAEVLFPKSELLMKLREQHFQETP
ncbi:MAG: tetratricopeptide repeat protein [Proteobacteria bacterium]|nr:tetratricopeptide repeat protein [Pseudomonadota bacterium]MDA0993622.1 tetratricopeptide repeat protein [Pseudomonadota bacterium]